MLRAGGGALSLLTKIVNNVQLSLRHLHFRYEDRTSSTAPFAIGVTLAELAAHSTDASGCARPCSRVRCVTSLRALGLNAAPTAAQRPRLPRLGYPVQAGKNQAADAPLRCALATPGPDLREPTRLPRSDLAVYHHCHCDQLLDPSLSLAETAAWLRSLVHRGAADDTGAAAASRAEGALGGHYVVQPVSLSARATLRPELEAAREGAPRIGAVLNMSALALRLAQPQLRDASRLVDFLQRRPALVPEADEVGMGATPPRMPLPLGTPGAARSAWRWAVQRVQAEQRRQRGWRMQPGFFEARRVARLRYVELYKRSQGRPWLADLTDPEQEARPQTPRATHARCACSRLAVRFTSCARHAQELQAMERTLLAVEDIVAFRSLADMQLETEAAAQEAAAAHSSGCADCPGASPACA